MLRMILLFITTIRKIMKPLIFRVNMIMRYIFSTQERERERERERDNVVIKHKLIANITWSALTMSKKMAA